jgi:hypothetical protein
MPQSRKPEGERGSTGRPAIRIVEVSLLAADLILAVFWNPDYQAMAAAWLEGIMDRNSII